MGETGRRKARFPRGAPGEAGTPEGPARTSIPADTKRGGAERNWAVQKARPLRLEKYPDYAMLAPMMVSRKG